MPIFNKLRESSTAPSSGPQQEDFGHGPLGLVVRHAISGQEIAFLTLDDEATLDDVSDALAGLNHISLNGDEMHFFICPGAQVPEPGTTRIRDLESNIKLNATNLAPGANNLTTLLAFSRDVLVWKFKAPLALSLDAVDKHLTIWNVRTGKPIKKLWAGPAPASSPGGAGPEASGDEASKLVFPGRDDRDEVAQARQVRGHQREMNRRRGVLLQPESSTWCGSGVSVLGGNCAAWCNKESFRELLGLGGRPSTPPSSQRPRAADAERRAESAEQREREARKLASQWQVVSSANYPRFSASANGRVVALYECRTSGDHLYRVYDINGLPAQR